MKELIGAILFFGAVSATITTFFILATILTLLTGKSLALCFTLVLSFFFACRLVAEWADAEQSDLTK